MNIEYASNAKKVWSFCLRNDDHANKIGIDYVMDNEKLKDESWRVYLIVVDWIIKKIWGSQWKWWIKSTMSFYINSMTWSPWAPRFIIHLLIEKELLDQKKVDLYMLTSPKVIASVSGLNKIVDLEIAAFKEMEDLCKSEYYESEQRYPDWNFQENNSDYPSELALKHTAYHQNRLKNKKS